MVLRPTRHASALKREEVALRDHSNSLEETPALSRRAFTLDAALAILAGCVITVTTACDDDDSPTTPTTPTADITGAISANHPAPHRVTITAAQITAGAALDLDIRGDSDHPHRITVSQTDLQTLRNRQPVSVASTTDNFHSHTVTFTPM
jgi:hypothetical protein